MYNRADTNQKFVKTAINHRFRNKSSVHLYLMLLSAWALDFLINEVYWYLLFINAFLGTNSCEN